MSILNEFGRPVTPASADSSKNEGQTYFNVERADGVVWLQIGVAHPQADDGMALLVGLSNLTQMAIEVFGPAVTSQVLAEQFPADTVGGGESG